MKRIISNIFTVIVSVFCVLLLFECVLRLFFPVYAPTAKSNHVSEGIMEHDPRFGWFHKKYFSTWIESQEYSMEVFLNAKGLRGKERVYEPPEKTERILVLGDSFAFGLGVKDDETFAYKLEELFQKAGEKVEVINMGVNGYGTDQELLLLKDEGKKYHPDIVVCQLFVGNDLEENTSKFKYNSYKPFYALESGKLKLNNYPVPEGEAPETVEKSEIEPKGRINLPFIKVFLQKHSYAFIFFRLRYNYLLYKMGVREGASEDIRDGGWAVTKLILQEMRDYCHQEGIRLVLVVVPTREQVIGVEKDTLQKKISEFCREKNIDCLDLLVSLKGRKDLYFVIDSHWNNNGHEVVAGILYDKLKNTHER